MVKYILTKLSIVIGFFGAFATPQSPNILVYNGDTISVYLNLLPDEFYKPDTVTIDSFEFINHILTVNVFGDEKGCPARSSIGVNVLPGNIPIEIEYMLELEEA